MKKKKYHLKWYSSTHWVCPVENRILSDWFLFPDCLKRNLQLLFYSKEK